MDLFNIVGGGRYIIQYWDLTKEEIDLEAEDCNYDCHICIAVKLNREWWLYDAAYDAPQNMHSEEFDL